MRDLDALLMFADVASRGSFSAAARATGVPKATLSRRIQKLESDLGVRLMNRNSRQIALTEAGRAFHDHCVRIAGEIESAQAAVGELGAGPRGVLRVSAPFTAARSLLMPMLSDFLVRYPKVRVALTLRNDGEELVSQHADVAIAASVSNASHASRLLLREPTHLHASPEYFARRRAPETPRDLAGHDLLAHSRTPAGSGHVWRLHLAEREEVVAITPLLVSNDLTPLHTAVLAGRGILMAPDAFLARDVESGRLTRVLADWRGPDLELRAVFGSRRGLLPKVRVFVDCLAERCKLLSQATPAAAVSATTTSPRVAGP